MDPTRAIKARVGAARLLLEQHVAGSALHATVSRLQTAAIIELIGQSSLSSQVRADLSCTVLAMKLAQPDMQAILEALGDGVASNVAKRRRVQQNWMAVHNYGTAEFWTRLQDPAMPGSCKLNLILQLAIGLGCRLPTEPSMKWMTSWWLSVAEAPSEVAKMDGAGKKAMLAHVKATFDGLRKAAGDPVVFLDKLPDNPVCFLRDFPSLYNPFFAADPPVVPGMSIQLIAALDMSYGCRGGAAKLQPQASTHLALPAAASLQLGDSPMERMAAMMFQRMEAMATSQQRIMEMAMSGTAHRANPRPLAALAGDTPLLFRKLPTIAIGGPCLALGDASDNSAGTPPPAPRPIIQAQTPPSATSGGEVTIGGGEEEEEGEECAESGELARMLDMMAARKAENNIMLAERKAAKKALGKGTGEATGEGTGDDGAVKGKGKGRGKGTGEATGEGTGDAGAVKGKGKGRGKGTGEATGDAGAVKGMGKGKVNLKNKATAKKAAAKVADKAAVLGCSKCRWSKGGCKQCKNPKYGGHRYS
jgi:hypothetical protein